MRQIGCLLICLSCLAAQASAAPVAPTVYVSWDGSGDYNCDGTADEVEINQALAYVVSHSGFTTVYLKGPHTYVIANSVKIGNNTTLTGNSGAVIKLKDHANWATDVPLVTATGTSGMHDITVHDFEIDGNDVNNYDAYNSNGDLRYRGHSWYNILYFRGVTRLNVYNMYLHDNMNDAMLVKSCSYVNYHDNRIIRHGHDGLYAYSSSYVTAYNNTITIRTNSGIRFSESNHCKAYLNNISKAVSGGAGFEIQRDSSNTMDDIEIYDNIVNGTAGAAVWLFGEASTSYTRDKARNVRIHNNIFYNCNGGVQATGFYDTFIENNVIDNCVSGIYIYVSSSFPAPPPIPTGTLYNATVRNNIICNNSYGIYNRLSAAHSVDSAFNCYFQNTTNFSGSNVTTANELLNVDPRFVNRSGRDYHLLSQGGHWSSSLLQWVKDSVTSPCIDAGYPQSTYANEPMPNGGRINIGAYGNTAQASKTPGYNSLAQGLRAWRLWE
ncbi:right-handed parallel beta-helix repeat-containing protein [bacterium]|nr:right-handed parallel beta-helix repeat-containing protein [bacterium]